jgi:alpha-glucuronidase
VGYDRTTSGTDYVSQYSPAVKARFDDPATCPEELLFWFHRVPYTAVLSSKKTVIQSIYDAHFDGANQVNAMRSAWEGIEAELAGIVYDDVRRRLQEQVYEARDFRDHVNNYFFELSQIPDAGGREVDQPFLYTDPPY